MPPNGVASFPAIHKRHWLSSSGQSSLEAAKPLRSLGSGRLALSLDGTRPAASNCNLAGFAARDVDDGQRLAQRYGEGCPSQVRPLSPRAHGFSAMCR